MGLGLLNILGTALSFVPGIGQVAKAILPAVGSLGDSLIGGSSSTQQSVQAAQQTGRVQAAAARRAETVINQQIAYGRKAMSPFMATNLPNSNSYIGQQIQLQNQANNPTPAPVAAPPVIYNPPPTQVTSPTYTNNLHFGNGYGANQNFRDLHMANNNYMDTKTGSFKTGGVPQYYPAPFPGVAPTVTPASASASTVTPASTGGNTVGLFNGGGSFGNGSTAVGPTPYINNTNSSPTSGKGSFGGPFSSGGGLYNYSPPTTVTPSVDPTASINIASSPSPVSYLSNSVIPGINGTQANQLASAYPMNTATVSSTPASGTVVPLPQTTATPTGVSGSFETQRALAGALGPQAQQIAFSNFKNDPGQAWLQQQGMIGINRNAAAVGGLSGGNRLKRLLQYNQKLAQQSLGNRITQLGNITTTEFNAARGASGVGVNLSNSLANSIISGGKGQAAGIVGAQAARISGAAGNQNAMGQFANQLKGYLNTPSGSSTGSSPTAISPAGGGGFTVNNPSNSYNIPGTAGSGYVGGMPVQAPYSPLHFSLA